MVTDKLYLVGFMGAGKTTVARALGKRLGWRVEDLDDLIEAREHCTVAQVFASRGDPLDAARQAHALINANGVAVWLDLPMSVALARVPADGRRPLAADRTQFEALYHARRLGYQSARVRLDASAPVEELVERTLDWLGY